MTAPGALQGLRVLDLSDEKGQYRTKLMADMGAEEMAKLQEEGVIA
jgi:hypothetical protein